jgi:hypothetical protein
MIVTSANIDQFVHVLGTDSAFSELGRVIAQAVSRWLPTPSARILFRAACGVCDEQEAMGQVFSEYFGFPYQSFHQFLHHHNHPGGGGGTICLLVATVPCIPNWTPLSTISI